jgi:hypothetical protein
LQKSAITVFLDLPANFSGRSSTKTPTMKPKSALRSFLALAGSSLLAISYTHADTLYWDGKATH